MSEVRAELRQFVPAHMDEAVRAILDSLGRIRFGSIAVTLHDGKVVQLDVTEKRRLTR